MTCLTSKRLSAPGAAFCTTVSYAPQLSKCLETGETGDLSIKMLLMLLCGLSLWIGYGAIRSDWVIITANAISLMLLGFILFFKLRGKDR